MTAHPLIASDAQKYRGRLASATSGTRLHTDLHRSPLSEMPHCVPKRESDECPRQIASIPSPYE